MCGAVVEGHSAKHEVNGLIFIHVPNFFGFRGSLETINKGGRFKVPASISGINGDEHVKAPLH